MSPRGATWHKTFPFYMQRPTSKAKKRRNYIRELLRARNMAVESVRVDEMIEMNREYIEKAFSAAWKAHKTPEKPFLLEKISSRGNQPEVNIISFAGSGTVKEWYSGTSFGKTEIDLNLFPSLKNVGYSQPALVNEAFLNRFKSTLEKSSLEAEVEKAMTGKKQIVFTGHSSGAPMAILATLWILEKIFPPKSHGGIPPLCVTFGSPLVGDHIFAHATNRENWSRYFWQIMMRYDIVPRISFAPLSSFDDQKFEAISQFFNPKSRSFMNESIGRDKAASDFFFSVMSNTATVTSHAACKLMGTTDATLETVANFIPLSPYRPFGTYIFCTGNGNEGKQIVVTNPDAVLQILFFSAQLSTEAEDEAANVAYRSLREHIINGTELQQALGMQNLVYLDQLLKVPLSDDGSNGDINLALNDLGLSTRARLCLRAAGELEERRCNNEEKMKHKVKIDAEKIMEKLVGYRETGEHRNKGYYDAFKEQDDPDEDFGANVRRLELAAVWDEIIEMLRRYDLPDEFEGNPDWIEVGTRFRRLVEPLDISNYYRHLRHTQSGPYMEHGRPRRYKYTQKWLEHSKRVPEEKISESCFWAEVEDICYTTSNNRSSFQDVEDRVDRLEDQIKTWKENGVLGNDVFVRDSTLVKWWKGLPEQHRQNSCIRNFVPA